MNDIEHIKHWYKMTFLNRDIAGYITRNTTSRNKQCEPFYIMFFNARTPKCVYYKVSITSNDVVCTSSVALHLTDELWSDDKRISNIEKTLVKEGFCEETITFIHKTIEELQEDLRKTANRIFKTIKTENGQRFEFFSSSEAAIETAYKALQKNFTDKTLYIEYKDGSCYYNDEGKAEEGSFIKTTEITTLYYCPNRYAKVVQIYGDYYIRSYKTHYEYTPYNDHISELDFWIAVGKKHNVGAPNPEKDIEDIMEL